MNGTALLYALVTVVCWGLYAVLLHAGIAGMDPASKDAGGSRMKAFLFVGIAYFAVAIAGPMVVMKMRGTAWAFPLAGWWWSLLAGVAGATGAFFLLMALSAGRTPAESRALPLLVPVIVFAGAPIVNTLVVTARHGTWGYVSWKFVAGIVLAAAGTVLVMKHRPSPPPVQGAVLRSSTGAPIAAPVRQSVGQGYTDVTRRRYHVT